MKISLFHKLYNNMGQPRSILVFSGRYHIISTASMVNNCIIFILRDKLVYVLS